MESRMVNRRGDEMIKSLEILYNIIEPEKIIHEQWQQVINKIEERNSEKISKNQRGFLVIIMFKVYEKTKKNME